MSDAIATEEPVETCRPIETPVGTIHGRTAFWPDDFSYDGNRLLIAGYLDGARATQADSGDLTFTVVFHSVLALQVLELDSWLHRDETANRVSCFDEVLHSRWIAHLGGKVEIGKHRHFSFAMYDEAIDVVCEKYEFYLYRKLPDSPSPSPPMTPMTPVG